MIKLTQASLMLLSAHFRDYILPQTASGLLHQYCRNGVTTHNPSINSQRHWSLFYVQPSSAFLHYALSTAGRIQPLVRSLQFDDHAQKKKKKKTGD